MKCRLQVLWCTEDHTSVYPGVAGRSGCDVGWSEVCIGGGSPYCADTVVQRIWTAKIALY
eukprot:2421659-Rhodomonas_salina.1